MYEHGRDCEFLNLNFKHIVCL